MLSSPASGVLLKNAWRYSSFAWILQGIINYISPVKKAVKDCPGN
jgi:hypothetical protein